MIGQGFILRKKIDGAATFPLRNKKWGPTFFEKKNDWAGTYSTKKIDGAATFPLRNKRWGPTFFCPSNDGVKIFFH